MTLKYSETLREQPLDQKLTKLVNCIKGKILNIANLSLIDFLNEDFNPS